MKGSIDNNDGDKDNNTIRNRKTRGMDKDGLKYLVAQREDYREYYVITMIWLFYVVKINLFMKKMRL